MNETILRKSNEQNKYVLMKPDYIEPRNGNVLMVWGDVPYWIVVDNDLFDFLESFSCIANINSYVYSNIKDKYDRTQVLKLIKILKKKGIVFKHGKSKMFSNKNLDNKKIENITLNLTDKCNLKCTFCYRYDKNTNESNSFDIDVEKISQFLKIARKYTSLKPIFSILGGEPFLNKSKLISVSNIANKLGFKVMVSTNGTLVDNITAKALAQMGVEVQVSIDSSTSGINDKLRGNGCFDKSIEGVKTLVKNGVYTILSCVYQHANKHDLENYYNMALKLGVNETRFIPIKIFGRAKDNKINHVSIFELVKNANKMFNDNPEFLAISNRDCFSILANTCKEATKKLSCGTGTQTILIHHDGSIYPCANMVWDEFKLGNIYEKDFNFKKTWFQSEIIKEYREKTYIKNLNEKCKMCYIKNWCMGFCRGEVYSMTKDLSQPFYNCDDYKMAITEMFWILSENNHGPNK